MTLTFTVLGVSQPQGSTKAFVPKGWTRAIVTSTTKGLKPWRASIAEAASRALENARLQPFAAGPVSLDVTFYLPRPQKFCTKKYAGVDVPHVTKPDTDKLVRACKDALTRVIWHDDSQVTDVLARKRYVAVGETPRAEITVTAVAGAQVPTKSKTPALFGEEDRYEAQGAR